MLLTPRNFSGTRLDQETNYFYRYLDAILRCMVIAIFRTLHHDYGIPFPMILGIASRLLLLKLSLIPFSLNLFLINIVL